MLPTPNRRVKLYQLMEGAWEDQGTGYIDCATLTKYNTPGLAVKSEDDESMILESKIDPRAEVYMRHQDTMILWSEISLVVGETLFLALSFQDPTGCQEIWDEIQDIQQAFVGDSALDEIFKTQEYDEDVELPPANLENLDEIINLLEERGSLPHLKEAISRIIYTQQYISKLVALFRAIVDLDCEENFSKMFEITRGLLLLNDRTLIEEMLSDKYCNDIFEALEYDPRVYPRVLHSQIIRDGSQFKQVVPFQDVLILNRIHQTFRLCYIRDALIRILDEPTYTTISAMVHLNNHHIITQLAADEEWIGELMLVAKAETNDQKLKQQVEFIAELCELSSTLEIKNKLFFHNSLVGSGLFEVLQKTLENKLLPVRLSTLNIFLDILGLDPSLLREYLLQQKPSHALFRLIISRLGQEPDSCIRNLLTDVIRTLLDEVTGPEDLQIANPAQRSLSASVRQVHHFRNDTQKLTFIEIMQRTNDEKQALLNLFYQDLAGAFFEPLTKPITPDQAHSEPEILLKCNLCDILGSFIEHHAHRSRNFLLKNSFMKRFLNLLKAKEKFLATAVIRVFRKIITLNEASINNYIISENLLGPVVDLFLLNGDRYNLLNSVVIELFQFIGENKPGQPVALVKYYMEKFHERLKHIGYVPTFKKLFVDYERVPTTQQDSNGMGISATMTQGDIIRAKRKFSEKEEEGNGLTPSNKQAISMIDDYLDANPLVPYEHAKKKLKKDSL